jgi:glycine hydroxymethyltransferase
MQEIKNNSLINDIAVSDPEIDALIKDEFARQCDYIELIASENFTSKAVMAAQGSVLTNKYAEGYPGKRYYGGCVYVDKVEELAIERCKQLFKCNFVNVQPHSGSQANQAVFMALLKPGDKILAMDLNAGGHLTHGSKVNMSGKWFEAIHYGVKEADGLIDYDELEETAIREKPTLIIAGGSACPRFLDFKRFRTIANKVGAYFLIDMAHFAGQVAAGLYSSNPVEYADVVTSTTHKTLRGPRGGLILTNNEDLAKKFNSAIFPGIQGGPLMHVIAAKAVAFNEALTPAYRLYMSDVVANAKALSETLIEAGYKLFTDGTDTHLLLVDLRPQGLTGVDVEHSLERAGLTCNKNSLPNDPQKPTVTSGIRLGSPAATSRGFKVEQFVQIGKWIALLIDAKAKGIPNLAHMEEQIRQEVYDLCQRFPIYS